MARENGVFLNNQNFLGGKWCGQGEVPVYNPATGEELARVPKFGRQETEHAIEAAQTAFKTWSKETAQERADLLKKWHRLIGDHKEILARLMTSEQGKPLIEARKEIDQAASFVEFYAEEAKRVYGETFPSPRKEARMLVIRQPIGVVGAITPWNFPAAMITRKVAPALAAGCTIVLKPALETPLTALALTQLAQEAGLPAGVLNVLTGDAAEIGEALCRHPAVKLISFTGSTEVGKVLLKQGADRVKKMALELGGNAPFIVFPDADLESIVREALQCKYRNMGQTCICANRFYVHEQVHEAFVEKLQAHISQLKVGNGLEEGVTQGPLIHEAAVQKVERHIADACQKGAQLILGGKRHKLGRTFFEPTLLKGASSDMVLAQEETFGPVAAIFQFRTEEEVIQAANNTPYGLAAYFCTQNPSRVWRVAEALDYGMIGINTSLLSSELAPFGGVKESGLGREGSRHGMEEFMELKYLAWGGLTL